MRILVTGFGPFLKHAENPSEVLARECGHPHEILEVSYATVEEFLGRLDPITFDALLMLAWPIDARPSAWSWWGATRRGTRLIFAVSPGPRV
jgi:hypothetical protein